jgi:hypothetical protein
MLTAVLIVMFAVTAAQAEVSTGSFSVPEALRASGTPFVGFYFF